MKILALPACYYEIITRNCLAWCFNKLTLCKALLNILQKYKYNKCNDLLSENKYIDTIYQCIKPQSKNNH